MSFVMTCHIAVIVDVAVVVIVKVYSTRPHHKCLQTDIERASHIYANYIELLNTLKAELFESV